jgi:ATP-binding protein involved in chromosome partitioning
MDSGARNSSDAESAESINAQRVAAARARLVLVQDPELHDDIVSLGMVRDVVVEGSSVVVHLALTIAGCPLRAELRDRTKAVLADLDWVESIRVEMGEMGPDERAALMARARRRAQERAPSTMIAEGVPVFAVASGKGGVGKSSITVNLALALARAGNNVGVLDADIWGFSVPRMLDVTGRLGGSEGKIEPQRRPVIDRFGAQRFLSVVSMGLLVDNDESALMWRGLILSKAVEQFLTDVRWGELDYLVIDMPPGTGDIQMALARLLPQAELLVVTTPALGAQTVAARAADMAQRGFLGVLGVIENMSWLDCHHGERIELFGHGGGRRLADSVGVPLLAQVPLDLAVSEGGDNGRPVAEASGPLADLFDGLADTLMGLRTPGTRRAGCTARLLDAVEASVAAAT